MTKTIDQFSALATPANDDYVPIWDTSAGAMKKIAFSGFSATAAIAAAVAAHAALATTHGVTGAIVGTTDTQTLSAKTLDSPTITTHAVVPLVYGSISANGDIIIHGTSHATKTSSYVILQPSGGGVAIGQLTAVSMLDVAGSIRGDYDTNTSSYFGRAAIGYDGATSDVAIFSHIDHASAAGKALAQQADGTTIVNTAAGRYISFSIANTAYYRMDSTAFYPLTDNAYDVGAILNRYDDVYATNGTIQTSDARLKDDVGPSDLGLAFIRALEPLRYRFAGKTRPHYGLASQQVRKVLDQLGIDDFAGYIHDKKADAYGLRYTEFIAPLITAIQEIANRLDRIEAA